MEFERRNYPELPQPSGAFHHSVRSGNTLYIAGSTAGGHPLPQVISQPKQRPSLINSNIS